MKFEEFETRAWEYWEQVPEAYKAGIDGLMVEREAKAHPSLPDIYTLGECLTESYPSDFGGPETIRSAVVLYYGSFWRLSRLDPRFDWEDELWETVTHELQHHLESLASEDDLVEMDYAADENFKRLEGEPFDPFFFRSGEAVSPGLWRVEREYFLEREHAGVPERSGQEMVEFEWGGSHWQVQPPSDPGDICFLWLEEGPGWAPEDEVTLVLLRRQGLGASLRALLGGKARRRTVVVEARGVVSPCRE